MSRPRSRANCSTRANRRMNLSVAAGQCLLRVGFNETGHIDGGKKQVAQLLLHHGGVTAGNGFLEFGRLAVQRFQRAGHIRPVKPHTAGPVLHLGGAH